jgi:hypothetical protein
MEKMEATSFVNAKEVKRWYVRLPVDYVCPRTEGSVTNHGMEVEQGRHYASLMQNSK